MAYNEFSIESALMPETQRRAVKLEGVTKVAEIFNSPSKSTEEFIQGAVTSLGNADCMGMYVHTSLEALEDRLMFASKLARPINTAKARGAEGFENVQTLDPWAYAIEGKVGDFFKRVWDAICTACRRVIEAIAHFIKWLGNAIASLDTRSQIKDYQTYSENKAKIDAAAKAAKTDDVKFKSLPWKVNADGVLKQATKAAGAYAKATKGMNNDQDLVIMKNAASKASTLGDKTKTAQDVLKVGLGFFGIAFRANSTDTLSAVRSKVSEITKKLQKQRTDDIASVFGSASGTNAHSIVCGAFASQDAVSTISVGEMKKLSKNFEVLKDEALTKNVKEVLSGVHEQQKVFSQYTKLIDSVAKSLQSAMAKADKNAGVGSISNELAKLANARIMFNSFWTSVMLELESYTLRFRKSAHIALKHYLRAAGAAKKDAKKKTTESLSQESLEAMFDFQN